MDAYQAIVSKRDRREFDGRPIPDGVLRRILQAGRMAGSAKNWQPVRLVVVREPAQKDALAECGRSMAHVRSSAASVAIVMVPEPEMPEGEFTFFRGPFDAGRAAQNMMVAAWAEGIASCPATTHDTEAAQRVLGLPPGHVVANVIAFGYPREQLSEAARESRPRLAWEEMVQEERWRS